MKYVLFICTHNAGRSQMAQAFFERQAPEDVRAESAGSDPAHELWPTVIEVMREVGIDLGGRRPRKLLAETQLHADWAVTMGCGDVCPYVPTMVEAWDIPDPAGLPLAEVRAIRDQVAEHVHRLIVERLDEIESDRSAHHWRLRKMLPSSTLRRSLLAEFLGAAFLTAVVIGSGIAAQRLSPSDTGLELFENAAATAAGLYTIILMFGPVSGAHFNPVVSLVDASFGGLSWRRAFAYIPAQVAGCLAGAIAANGMFATAAISISTKHRGAPSHLLAEVIATLGLLLVIFSLARTKRAGSAPAAVGAYIGAAYFFTSSTSFANPAIDIGRMFSDSFAGIAPASVPGYAIAQLVGGIAAIIVLRTLYPDVTPAEAAEVVMPHPDAYRPPPHLGPSTPGGAR